MLVPLPDGYTALLLGDALIDTFTRLPAPLRRSLAWDQGNEMFHHPRIESSTGMRIYFADPHSPWQRGTNENTNGLLRQYFPKSADLAVYTVEHIHGVAAELNDRPPQVPSMTSLHARPCDDQDTNSASCSFATFARDCPSSSGRAAQSCISSSTRSVIREIVSLLTEAP